METGSNCNNGICVDISLEIISILSANGYTYGQLLSLSFKSISDNIKSYSSPVVTSNDGEIDVEPIILLMEFHNQSLGFLN